LNGPVIISEALQELALKMPVAERLKIDWSNPKLGAVDEYMGFLAATQQMAEELASRKGKQTPGEAEYLSAFFLECVWPPNKQPKSEQYWQKLYPAFYDEKTKQGIRSAIGKSAEQLPPLVGDESQLLEIDKNTSDAEFQSMWLNLKDLKGFQE
jgi:hypothetical protein